MIVICEECGKKYQIDPSRLKAAGATAKCKACGSVMHISKPEPRPVERRPPVKPAEPPPPPAEAAPAREPVRAAPEPAAPEPAKAETRPGKEPAVAPKKKKGMGLRAKIFLLFFVIPILLIGADSHKYEVRAFPIEAKVVVVGGGAPRVIPLQQNADRLVRVQVQWVQRVEAHCEHIYSARRRGEEMVPGSARVNIRFLIMPISLVPNSIEVATDRPA